MSQTQNLREKRAKLAHDAKEITSKAAAETRAMTSDETQSVERMFAEIDGLKAAIDAAERAEAIERSLDAPVRVTEPTAPGRGAEVSFREIATDPAWSGREFAVYKDGEERAVAKSNITGVLSVDVVSQFEEALKWFGPMWEVSEVFQTETGNSLNYPTVNDTANVAEIKAEGQSITTTVDPTFSSVVFGAYKYSSKAILVGIESLQDSLIPLEGIIGRLLAERLARQTNAAFTTGTGTDAPQGIVTAAVAGSTGATNAISYDNLVDLIHSVDPWYRKGASIMAHDSVVAYLRKLKDSNGLPLWEPSVKAGQPDTLLGYPLYSNSSMASAVSTGNKTVLFGQFKKFKVRRVGSLTMTIARELYAASHQVGFFGFLRCDSKLVDAGTNPVKYFVQA